MTEKKDSTNKTDKLLKGILLALALKEIKREDKAKILKVGGLKQAEIIKLIGISETTKRTRKHRKKKKQAKSKRLLSKLVGGGKNERKS